MPHVVWKSWEGEVQHQRGPPYAAPLHGASTTVSQCCAAVGTCGCLDWCCSRLWVMPRHPSQDACIMRDVHVDTPREVPCCQTLQYARTFRFLWNS